MRIGTIGGENQYGDGSQIRRDDEDNAWTKAKKKKKNKKPYHSKDIDKDPRRIT